MVSDVIGIFKKDDIKKNSYISPYYGVLKILIFSILFFNFHINVQSIDSPQ